MHRFRGYRQRRKEDHPGGLWGLSWLLPSDVRICTFYILTLLPLSFDWTITAAVSVKKCEAGESVKGRGKGGGKWGEKYIHFCDFSRGEERSLGAKISCKSSWRSAGTRTGGRVISRQ